jgi:hypothetical protein
VIQPGQDISAATPEAPKYQIGAWMSNNTPSGGSVKVFVRLSQNVAPVKDIPVTLSVEINGETLTYGPTNTDEYGLVTFTVEYGGISGSPAFVTASAKIDEQTTLTAETVFVPP